MWGKSIVWKIRKSNQLNTKVQTKGFEPNAACALSFWRRSETEILIWQYYKNFIFWFTKGSTCENQAKKKKKQWKIIQSCSKRLKLQTFPLPWVAPLGCVSSSHGDLCNPQCPKSWIYGNEQAVILKTSPNSRIATYALLKASSFPQSQSRNPSNDIPKTATPTWGYWGIQEKWNRNIDLLPISGPRLRTLWICRWKDE